MVRLPDTLPGRPERIGVDVPELIAGRPHIWLMDVTRSDFEALADRKLCSTADVARAEALRDAAARRRALARRAALRIILGRYLACEPGAIRLVIAPGGKPVVLPTRGCTARKPLAFSIGHSGDLYCVAVGADTSVGVDVERLRPVSRAGAIASRWFGPVEAASLDGLDGAELDRAFMRLWTCKEALAKRHGAGLRLMQGQSGEAEVRDALDVTRESEAGRLVAFEPAAGYLGAVAGLVPVIETRLLVPEEATWTI